jgi:hypothetical protein
MTLLEKCELAKQKGCTYDSLTGIIYGVKGNIIKKTNLGYIILTLVLNKKCYYLRAHHFAWYMVYNNVDFEVLDHFNQIKTDNRIDNLRAVTQKSNLQNKMRTTKGYSWSKQNKKWQSKIGSNGKTIHLGYFETKEEALNEYLKAKKQYHFDFCSNF